MDYKKLQELDEKGKVVDIGENLDAYLDRKTIERLDNSKKLITQLEQLDSTVGQTYKVIYVGKKIETQLTESVVKEFARSINNLGRKYIIQGSLLKCSMINFDGVAILASYIALLPSDAEDFLKNGLN